MQIEYNGKSYNSISELCREQEVSIQTTCNRLRNGYTIEEALSKEPLYLKNKEVYDHLGNKFNSFIDMCKHWGIEETVVRNRIKSGYSLERALTSKLKRGDKVVWEDHSGIRYRTFTDMCKAYHKGGSTST